MHAITRAVLPGDLVFDIGANTGEKASWFASRNVRVIAVEPQPMLAAQLRKKFESNPQVTIVQKGIAARAGRLPMSISTNHVLSTFSAEWKTGRFAGETWESSETIEVVTFDRLIREYGVPRYAKIDVEGYEKQVLAGLTKKIGVISFEFTAEFFETARDICKSLENLGYRFFNFRIAENDDFVLDAGWADCKNLIFAVEAMLAKDKLLWGDIYVA